MYKSLRFGYKTPIGEWEDAQWLGQVTIVEIWV